MLSKQKESSMENSQQSAQWGGGGEIAFHVAY